MTYFSIKKNGSMIFGLAIVSIFILYIIPRNIDCAPTKNNGNNNNGNKNTTPNRIIRPGLLSNLFRRQTSTNNEGNSNVNSSNENDIEDPQSQTELDAQKFMDSLPNAGASNTGPSSFRERVSDTFGVLRDGVNNHFKSIRENFSDTVEDLRDTWTSGGQE